MGVYPISFQEAAILLVQHQGSLTPGRIWKNHLWLANKHVHHMQITFPHWKNGEQVDLILTGHLCTQHSSKSFRFHIKSWNHATLTFSSKISFLGFEGCDWCVSGKKDCFCNLRTKGFKYTCKSPNLTISLCFFHLVSWLTRFSINCYRNNHFPHYTNSYTFWKSYNNADVHILSLGYLCYSKC